MFLNTVSLFFMSAKVWIFLHILLLYLFFYLCITVLLIYAKRAHALSYGYVALTGMKCIFFGAKRW